MVEIKFEEKEILVSSAYILATESLSFRAKSLMKIKKSSEPKQDPCVVPNLWAVD